eukprot:2904978-Prymnesium_polylepis.1
MLSESTPERANLRLPLPYMEEREEERNSSATQKTSELSAAEESDRADCQYVERIMLSNALSAIREPAKNKPPTFVTKQRAKSISLASALTDSTRVYPVAS